MTWRFLGIAFALLVVVVVVLIMFGRLPFPVIQFVLQVPDGNNPLINGGFEKGKLNDPDPDESVVGTARILCDGSTSINNWVAAGPGPGGSGGLSTPCSGGRHRDVLEYAANQDHCEPNVPPCPNEFGILAQEGNRYVNLSPGQGPNLPARQYGTVTHEGVQTVVGQRYEVSFFIGSSSNNLIVGDKTGAVSVEIAGVKTPDSLGGGCSFQPSLLCPAPPPLMASNWSDPHDKPRFRFDAVNETTILKFSGTSVSKEAKGTLYIGLDNVSLEKVCVIFIAFTVGC